MGSDVRAFVIVVDLGSDGIGSIGILALVIATAAVLTTRYVVDIHSGVHGFYVVG